MMQENKELNKAAAPVDMVQLFKNYAPFFSFIALCYGVLSQWIYYKGFNINILDYTTFNELLISALVSLIFIVVYTLIIGGGYWYSLQKVLKKKDNYKRITIFILGMPHAIAAILFAGYCFIFSRWDSYTEWSVFLFLSIYVILAILIWNFDKYYRVMFNNEPDYLILKMMGTFLTVINFSICIALFNVSNTKQSPPVGSGIVLGNKTILSTKDYYLVGRTNNFTFFYDVKKDQAEVFSNKDINRILLK